MVIQIIGRDEPSIRIGHLQAGAVRRRVEVMQRIRIDLPRVVGQDLRSRIRALPVVFVEGGDNGICAFRLILQGTAQTGNG